MSDITSRAASRGNKVWFDFHQLFDWCRAHGMRAEVHVGDELKRRSEIVEWREVTELRVIDGAKSWRQLCDGLDGLNGASRGLLNHVRAASA